MTEHRIGRRRGQPAPIDKVLSYHSVSVCVHESGEAHAVHQVYPSSMDTRRVVTTHIVDAVLYDDGPQAIAVMLENAAAIHRIRLEEQLRLW